MSRAALLILLLGITGAHARLPRYLDPKLARSRDHATKDEFAIAMAAPSNGATTMAIAPTSTKCPAGGDCVSAPHLVWRNSA